MSESEKTSVRLKVDDVRNIPVIVDQYLNGDNPPNIVLLQLDPEKFPRRTLDFPEDVRKYVMTHPRVKVEWSDLDDNHKLLDYKCLCGWDVIVSLTTFPSRMKCPELLQKCLQSIVSQKTEFKFHVVLVIFKNDMPFIDNLTLEFCSNNGIEILPCEEDLKGHKKYFYTMKKYPGIPIILVDDDVIFYDNLVESLIQKYHQDDKVIWTGWCQLMNISTDGKLQYDDKRLISNSTDETPSFKYKFGSGSGTLIPPYLIDDFDSLHNLICEGDNIFHDELVLKKLAIDKNIKVGLCLNRKYKCMVGGWLTHTQFIENEIQPLVEAKGNLHSINCSKVYVNGNKKYRGMVTEINLFNDYIIYDNIVYKC